MSRTERSKYMFLIVARINYKISILRDKEVRNSHRNELIRRPENNSGSSKDG